MAKHLAKTPDSKRKRAPRKGEGRPPFVPNDVQRIRVEAMVAAGAQQWFIAEDLKISEDTLQRYFRVELDHGKDRALSKIGASMVTKALEGDHDAAKFVLARVGGWKQTIANENSGPNGGPQQHVVRNEHDFSKLTREEKRQLEGLLAKADGSS